MRRRATWPPCACTNRTRVYSTRVGTAQLVSGSRIEKQRYRNVLPAVMYFLTFKQNHIYVSISLLPKRSRLLVPFLQSGRIMIDGKCTNAAPELLSALKGSAQPDSFICAVPLFSERARYTLGATCSGIRLFT